MPKAHPRALSDCDTGPVTSANLELVRSIYNAWERGDYRDIGWAHPEIEFAFADGPAPGSWTGTAAMAEAWIDALGPWEGLSVEPEAYRELDGERVLVLTRNAGRGRGSGLELDQMLTRTANLFHVRGGKVTRLVMYFNRDRAFADVGMASIRDTPDRLDDKGEFMLENTKAYSGFAVDDMDKARAFYAETLGLPVSDVPPGLMVTLAGGRETLIYHKPDFEPATYTMLNFEVPDVEAAVDELNSRGIEMERYDGFGQDEKGIVRVPDFPAGAWFTDPAGNIIAVHEPMSA
jgi:predicted enzyme related to lactoylglutathione lyase/ketosteroid isomerase-like protein